MEKKISLDPCWVPNIPSNTCRTCDSLMWFGSEALADASSIARRQRCATYISNENKINTRKMVYAKNKSEVKTKMGKLKQHSRIQHITFVIWPYTIIFVSYYDSNCVRQAADGNALIWNTHTHTHTRPISQKTIVDWLVYVPFEYTYTSV